MGWFKLVQSVPELYLLTNPVEFFQEYSFWRTLTRNFLFEIYFKEVLILEC